MDQIQQPNFYRKVIINMKTGAVLASQPFKHYGPIGSLMPNQHPHGIKTNAQLNSGVNVILTPDAAVERIPWIWYHAQTYTSASTTQLIFFNATGGIQTTNMQAASQIPSPMFYDLYHIGIYYQIPVSNVVFSTSAGTALGAANDSVLISNAIATLTYAQKTYYQGHLWTLPPGTGVNSNVALAGTFSATNGSLIQVGQIGMPDLRNRYSFFGDITIAHNQNFQLQMDWASAVTLNNGNTTIVAYLDGYLYRRAL